MYPGEVRSITVSLDDRDPRNRADCEPTDLSTREQRTRRREAGGPEPDVLEAVVVRYEIGPDRCTIFPRGCSDEEKLTRWLSADLSAFVDLETVR